MAGQEVYSRSLKYLTILGYGKITTSKKWKSYLYKTYSYVTVTSIIVNGILGIIDLYVSRNDMQAVTENLCANLPNASLFVKLFIIIFRKKKIEIFHDNFGKCFGRDDVGVTKEDKDIINEQAHSFSLLLKTVLCVNVISVTVYVLLPILDNEHWGRQKLFIPFPVHEIPSPVFEVMFALQTAFMYYFVLTFNVTDMLFIGFAHQICAQFEILNKNVQQLRFSLSMKLMVKVIEGSKVSDDGHDSNQQQINQLETKKRLSRIVSHHQDVLNQLEEINNIYSSFVLIQLAMAVTLLALVAFDVIINSREISLRTVSRSLYMIDALVVGFVFCYYGSKVQTMSSQVGRAVYDLPWFDGMDMHSGKTCLLIMARSQRPTGIRGGKFFIVSLGTYLKILDFSYRLIAALEQLKK